MTETYGTDPLGYYAIIGVAYNAGEQEIKQNYRERAKLWHPDHNTGEEAKDNFQKLSVAYGILEDEEQRLIYDLLSSAYPAEKFPSGFSLKVYKNRAGQEDINIRAVKNTVVIGKIFSYSERQSDEVCSYPEAVKLVTQTSLTNWLAGWWSLPSFFKNIRAIMSNFNAIGGNRAENYRLMVHNAIAYKQNNNAEKAWLSAMQALQYANAYQKSLLKKFADSLKISGSVRLRPWNNLHLKLVQLIAPATLLLLCLIPFSVEVVSESELMSWFMHKKEIDYHQTVRFADGAEMSDDMVVSKIINIPVDIYDGSKLYHVTSDVNVMHGPADDFDVLRRLRANGTVRLTGLSPDNIWARIMLDEGEMGFVRMENLRQGIGKAIPYGSKIAPKKP